MRDDKITRLKHKCLQYNIDILCLVEEGQNLRLTPEDKKLKLSTDGWWESRKCHQAYNRHFNTGRQDQVGGVSVTITNALSHRIRHVTDDPSGLRRWTSMTIEGKNAIRTRIISAYRPCKSTRGLETAYTQHLMHWDSLGRTRRSKRIFYGRS
jgi:hypothetical protein